ncbi:MAG TPA: methyl-accepting chemotaxis protein [Burkholderiaceae bacterium]|nr:methyl-accepting chemotaxis protein [Burkholderiaceae bacterium]
MALGAAALLGSLCAGLPLLQRADMATLLAWLGVSGTGLAALLADRWLRRGARSASHATAGGGEPEKASVTPGLPAFLRGVLPVWHSQVTLARDQTEQAAGKLVGDLSGLSAQFDAAGFGDDVGVRGRGQALLDECEHKLKPVLTTMGEIAASHAEVVDSLRGMMGVTDELRGMADEVARIAQQTNLLAINAAIEAARAGEAGRGFSVVAAEVRRLSQDSADTARRIAQRIEQVTAMMSSTSSTALQTAERDGRSIAATGSVVEEVLTHVRELGEGSVELIAQGQAIRGSLENLVVGLQFQDRVSQIVSAVEQDIARLLDAIESGAALPPQQHWLQRLEQAYTMRDQRQQHRGPIAASEPPAAAPAPRAVFF